MATAVEQNALENDGFCVICESAARFVSRYDWLRDHYKCTQCGSIPRERALLTVLNERFPHWRSLQIHESSPALPSSVKMARECPHYLATHFFPDVPLGTIHKGYRCEDLEKQTFPDGSFDLVITQDVMEHVLDPEQAFREIARTLRSGGAHIFTTPIYKNLSVSERRARRRGDSIEYLSEPEYHGNPIDEKGSLVTIHYGQDIGDLIGRASGTTTTIYRIVDRARGIDGEFLDVLVSVVSRSENGQVQFFPGDDRHGKRSPLASGDGVRHEHDARFDGAGRASATNFRRFRSLGDEEWHRLLQRSVKESVIDGVRFPGFPPEVLQTNFVGSANEAALDEAYTFFCHVQHWRAKRRIALDATTKVLDFGTGWGRIIRFFLRDIEPQNLHGVDVDPDILRTAAETGLPCQFSVVPPLGPTPFPDSTFDLVIAYSVFTHLAKAAADRWMKELARITKPGGLLLATTQRRHFIEYCASLAGKEHEIDWHRALAGAFPDPAQAQRAYDAGEFVYVATGGGEYRDASFYGEACVPERYVRRNWCNEWRLLEYLDDRSRFWQAVIVMQRKAEKRGWRRLWTYQR